MGKVPSPEINDLRQAYRSKNLVLYLGAGISAANNLPTWEKLVLALYFLTVSEQHLGGWRPFSNYLYAISEWYLENNPAPLEITARKLKKLYEIKDNGDKLFLDRLHRTLYGSLLDDYGMPLEYIDPSFIRGHNSTLDAVARLCESPVGGVRAAVTYNYDNLLEIALGDGVYQSIFRKSKTESDSLPIYHVHGYVPLDPQKEGSTASEIVFTEDQYHTVASYPYFWSNLVQLKCMSNSVGLMVGLSLSDPNMRRLLDAVQNAPVNTVNYALLRMPDEKPPNAASLDKIHKKAVAYFDKFERSGVKTDHERSSRVFFQHPGVKSSYPVIPSSRADKKGPAYRSEVAGIIEQVKKLDQEQQQQVLRDLGIIPVWYKKHADIPKFIAGIMT